MNLLGGLLSQFGKPRGRFGRDRRDNKFKPRNAAILSTDRGLAAALLFALPVGALAIRTQALVAAVESDIRIVPNLELAD